MTDESNDARLTALGVDAETGKVDSIGLDEVREIVEGLAGKGESPKGVPHGFDEKKLSSVGWGIIVPRHGAAERLAALGPLIELRRRQVGRRANNRFNMFEHHPGDTKSTFLDRYKAETGTVDPDRMPYYLLIAGTPEEIPWRFQYELDAQYAVGRVGFDDQAAYQRYAGGVVAVEDGEVVRQRRAVFVGPRHKGEWATGQTRERLIDRLAERLARHARRRRGWTVEVEPAEQATKRRLLELLGTPSGPAVVMTAGHGLLQGDESPERRERHGALVCQDWPGSGPIESEHVLAASDLGGGQPSGLIAFCFACHSAGSPAFDDYVERRKDRQHLKPIDRSERRPIARSDFASRLPLRLLEGGALAVVGHVERAWVASFVGRKEVPRLGAFQSLLAALVDGVPVGHAMDRIDAQWGEAATQLSDVWRRLREGAEPGPDDLIELWTAHNDARGWVVLGDPAVRVAVGKAG